MRLCALAILLSACIGVPGDSVGDVVQALGEPMGTFPSPEERLGIMALNRARSDPSTIKGPQSKIYPPRPPVQWSYPLSQSARFMARNIQLSNVTLMHTSPCKLNTNIASSGCDGTPACACATPVPSSCAKCASVPAINTCGTDTFTRIGYFTAGTTTNASGEIASAGYSDALATVDGWMDEPAGADGHRTNILDVGISSNVMGYGHAEGAGCYPSFDYSDSGMMASLPVAKLPTAAVSPYGGAAGNYTFYATWADPASGAPALLDVVVDGACTPMTRELGSDTLNATYKVSMSLASGCHTYWILAKDKGGARITFPTTGAITITVGSGSCSGAFVTQQPAAACEGAPPPMHDASTSTGTSHEMGVAGDLSMSSSSGAAIGAPCMSASDCASQICASTATGGVCTQSCDPTDPTSCPSSFQCSSTSSGNYCLPPSGGGASGCAIGGAPRSNWWSFAALALVISFLRRKRYCERINV